MPKPRGGVEMNDDDNDDKISTSTPPPSLGIYKTLLARKLFKPKDGRYRPKHVVFPLLINTII